MENIHLPSLMLDPFGDLVAINTAILKMYNVDISIFQDSSVNQATKFNIMRMCFSDEFDLQRRMMREAWPLFAHHSIISFRTISFRYRAHPYFRYLLPELKKFKLFRSYWEIAHYGEYPQYFGDSTFFSAYDPKGGLIRSISSTIRAMTTHGELILYSFVPLNLKTANTFFEISKEESTKLYRLSPWPDKQIPA